MALRTTSRPAAWEGSGQPSLELGCFGCASLSEGKETPEEQPRRGWSRRDILRGAFLRRPLEASASSGAGFVGEPGPDAVVMRYPRTLEEVQPERSVRSSINRHAPVLRPPGAVAEPAFLQKCTQCGDCIRACPYDAIHQAPLRLRSAAGTPILDPIRQPCWLCTDTPCIAACETGALSAELELKLGTARILEQTCLAYQGTGCTTCSERCPVDGAITLAEGKPRVVEDACTGCGVCQYVCPAPQNAVLLMPMYNRPMPPVVEQP